MWSYTPDDREEYLRKEQHRLAKKCTYGYKDTRMDSVFILQLKFLFTAMHDTFSVIQSIQLYKCFIYCCTSGFPHNTASICQ